MDIALFILIGLGIGWLARVVLEDRGFGRKGNVVAGIVGALVGGLLFKVLMAIVEALAPQVAALFGAVLLIAIGNQRVKKKASGKL